MAPRVAALVVVCIALGLVIVSSLLPGLADSKATSALAVTTQADEAELQDAAATAEAGARLDPTAVASLLAAANLAQNRGRLVDARRYLLQAVDRQPYNVTAWRRLLALALDTADRRGAKAAAEAPARARPDRGGHARAGRPARAVQRAGERVCDRDRHAAEPGLLGGCADGDADAHAQSAGPAAGIPQTAAPGTGTTPGTGTPGSATTPGVVPPPPPPPPAGVEKGPTQD